MILVTGGGKSGKSRFAEELVQKAGENILYIATAEAVDAEMKHRIELHQQRRPEGWKTHEGYVALEKVVQENSNVDGILLDCVTVWLTNLCFYFGGFEEAQMDYVMIRKSILAEVEKFIISVNEATTSVVLVTNEIGLGLVPGTKFSRFFRDLAGEINERLAKEAEYVYFVVSGIPLQIKGASL